MMQKKKKEFLNDAMRKLIDLDGKKQNFLFFQHDKIIYVENPKESNRNDSWYSETITAKWQ